MIALTAAINRARRHLRVRPVLQNTLAVLAVGAVLTVYGAYLFYT